MLVFEIRRVEDNQCLIWDFNVVEQFVSVDNFIREHFTLLWSGTLDQTLQLLTPKCLLQ